MLGKRANCQTLVSLTLARQEIPVAVGLRLFLPESWTGDAARMDKAGVPEAFRQPRSKPEIALQEIDRLIAQRRALRRRSHRRRLWPVGRVPSGLERAQAPLGRRRSQTLKGLPADVSLIFPMAGRGRPRKNQIPDQLSAAAETMLASAKWPKLSWRRGVKGPLAARFAARRIRVADGPPRIFDKGQQHMPGEEAWLIGEGDRPANANISRQSAGVRGA